MAHSASFEYEMCKDGDMIYNAYDGRRLPVKLRFITMAGKSNNEGQVKKNYLSFITI